MPFVSDSISFFVKLVLDVNLGVALRYNFKWIKWLRWHLEGIKCLMVECKVVLSAFCYLCGPLNTHLYFICNISDILNIYWSAVFKSRCFKIADVHNNSKEYAKSKRMKYDNSIPVHRHLSCRFLASKIAIANHRYYQFYQIQWRNKMTYLKWK